MKKIRVAVLMGGKTPEHEISLISGREVVRHLPKKYDVLPVIISRDGAKWSLVDKKILFSLGDPLKLLGTKREILEKKESKEIIIPQQMNDTVDVCFIVMHGPYGEDGTIQGMLELAGVSYTGSGVLASALGMDKIALRRILESEGIRGPRYVAVKQRQGNEGEIKKKIGSPPYFVKPHNQGSSVGASIVGEDEDLGEALDEAFKYSDIAMVEEYIEGKEITCGVIGNDDPKALPLIEVVPLKGDFFNYQSKYMEFGADEIVPARISKALAEKIQKIAVEVYKLIGCRGFARVDLLVDKKNEIFVLEINTIPGLTPISLMPKAAKAAGISYSKLLDKIINYAL